MAKMGNMGGATPGATPAPQGASRLGTLIQSLNANRTAAPIAGVNPVFQRMQGAFAALNQSRQPAQKRPQMTQMPMQPAPAQPSQAPAPGANSGFRDIFAAMIGNRR